MGISILAVSLPQELLKDAVWHLQQARTFEGDQANCFLLWREVRSAIMFAVTAVEALFNMAATEHVARHPDLPSPIRDHLLEQESRVNREGAVEQRFRLVPLEDKISVWTRIITGNVFDKSDEVWRRFVKAKDFRNALMHYRPSSSTVYNEGTVATAKDAIESCRAIIERY